MAVMSWQSLGVSRRLIFGDRNRKYTVLFFASSARDGGEKACWVVSATLSKQAFEMESRYGRFRQWLRKQIENDSNLVAAMDVEAW